MQGTPGHDVAPPGQEGVADYRLDDGALACALTSHADDFGEEDAECGAAARGGGGVLQAAETRGQDLQGLRHGR